MDLNKTRINENEMSLWIFNSHNQKVIRFYRFFYYLDQKYRKIKMNSETHIWKRFCRTFKEIYFKSNGTGRRTDGQMYRIMKVGQTDERTYRQTDEQKDKSGN